MRHAHALDALACEADLVIQYALTGQTEHAARVAARAEGLARAEARILAAERRRLLLDMGYAALAVALWYGVGLALLAVAGR